MVVVGNNEGGFDDSMSDPIDASPWHPRRIRQVPPLRSRRRYRAQTVLLLLCLIGIAYITLKDRDIVTKRMDPENSGLRTLDEALGAISPLAKKKVLPSTLNCF